MEEATLAVDFLRCLHEREVERDAPAARQRFAAAFETLTGFARQTDADSRDRLLCGLREGLSPQQSNWEFGGLANTCGMIVEMGGDPTIALEPILERITAQFGRVPEYVRVMQDHLGVEHPNQVAEQDWQALGENHPEHAWVIGDWIALRFTGCAAMAMLCRDAAARIRARERIELVQRAESARSDNPYAYYLAELLGMADDERLLVLDVSRRLGFRVRLTAIRNNFHLFTLLQDALLAHPTARAWSGPRIRPLVVSVAKSERMLPDIAPHEWNGFDSDAAIWTYYAYHAMKPDGTLRTLNERNMGEAPSWVWGEGKFAEIPMLDGERIVLLGPLEMPRSWDVGFFAPLHQDLRSAVVIEAVISPMQLDRWMRTLRNA